MITREVERMGIVLQEERLKVSQGVLFTKQAPDAVLKVWMAVVELYGLHLGELGNQGFIDDEMLLAIFTGRLVLVLPYPGL